MNILGICLSPGKGGLELYAHKVITALQQKGHNCHFAITANSFLTQLEWRLSLVDLKPSFRIFPYASARQLAKYIDTYKIDIIHMHWNKDLNLAVLAKSLSQRKPKLVYSRHMEIPRSKKDVYHKLLYRQVDLMLVIAKYVLEQAIQFIPLQKDRIRLLYLGVEETEQVTLQECKTVLAGCSNTEGKFTIGMVGRIEAYKGQHILIEALAIMKRNGQNFQLVMAGPIMDQDYFEKLNQQIRDNGLFEQVKYLGVSREPGRIMGCCDVVVLTTFCETFGLVLAEAMRAGTVVVGTNAGGVPEIIKHNVTGLLFEPGNQKQLAECLTDLLHDLKKRESLAQAGKSYADRMFDEEQHLIGLESIFSDLSEKQA